jgi:hypothetical protein
MKDEIRGRYSGEPGMIEYPVSALGHWLILGFMSAVWVLVVYCFLAFFHLAPWP